MSMREAVVLLVDDDEGDRALTQIALKSSAVQVRMEEAVDAADALDYLRHTGRYSDPSSSPRPDIILLDLNMPKMDGKEFLAEIAGTSFASIPVVILTTSDAKIDISTCYALGCASYVSKPVELDGFANAISQLGNYWFQLVTLPEQ